MPCPEQVAASLDFLAGLGISDAADVGPLVGGFPEVLGLRVEVMQENVDVLKKKWFLKVRPLVRLCLGQVGSSAGWEGAAIRRRIPYRCSLLCWATAGQRAAQLHQAQAACAGEHH